MHVRSESPILYFGTPVVLISTENEDGSANIGPMSSCFWLGWRALLGLDASSKTTENLRRTGQCVLNLPSADQVAMVDAIARTTGSDPMPDAKAVRGYETELDKFGRGGFTKLPSEVVGAPRIGECPVQMEASLSDVREIAADTQFPGWVLNIEVSIERLYLDEAITMDGNPNRVDPDKWNPLIMSFQEFYGLDNGKLHTSRLGEVPEDTYPRVGAQSSTGGLTIELA